MELPFNQPPSPPPSMAHPKFMSRKSSHRDLPTRPPLGVFRIAHLAAGLVLLLAMLATCPGVLAVSPTAPSTAEVAEPSLAIAWNLPLEQAAGKPFTHELVLTNHGPRTLGPEGWQLYFNFFRSILPESDTQAVRFVHVNGDFYRLEPRSEFAPLEPGASVTLQFFTDAASIKASDAPDGFFLVTPGGPTEKAQVEHLGHPTIGPIDSERQSRRTPQDVVPVPTSRSRYEANLQLATDAAAATIVPTPVLLQAGDGEIRIGPDTVIIADANLSNEAAYLADALEPLLGRKLTQQSATSTSAIRLAIGDLTVGGVPKTAGDHAYRLQVGPEISLTGTDPAGVFCGLQSLRGWLPLAAEQPGELRIPAVTIEDAPRFGYRGLHLDVARNFHTPESVKKLLEVMALYKLNKFHFHLTDDEGWRLTIAGLPELTEVGARRGFPDDESLPPSFGSGPDPTSPDSHGSGYYTRAEFVDLLRYAAQRHIEVIPELDLPGHSRAAIRSMEIRRQRLAASGREAASREFLLHDPADKSSYQSVQLWNDNVVNVCQESTDHFIDHVVTDIRSMYAEAGLTLKTLHLGGDEVPRGVWSDSPACQELPHDESADPNALAKDRMGDFMFRVAQQLSASAPLIVGAWEEAFHHELSTLESRNGINRFSGPQFLCYAWNNVWGWGMEDLAYRLANAGVNVVLCNATDLYLDLVLQQFTP